MKKLTKLMSVLSLASAIAMTAARAQFSTISVDELGGGFYNGLPVPAGFLPDLFNGGAPGFAYTLPFPFILGAAPVADILLFEPGSPQQLPSDLLRFERDPNGAGTLLFFYSDASSADAPDAPADVLVMPAPITPPFLAALETGLFGNPYTEAGPNGFVYMAGPGMPGWDGNPLGTQYTFISDVPEPASLWLLSGGLGAFCWLRLLRRKVRS